MKAYDRRIEANDKAENDFDKVAKMIEAKAEKIRKEKEIEQLSGKSYTTSLELYEKIVQLKLL